MTTDYKPKKRSLSIKGHQTSVTLEGPFWEHFKKIAKEKSESLNSLASKIDADREPDVGLASSIRVFCLMNSP
tara:strand:- start:54 stop:272 length:219 start_codon:yes stop_codon:yes gene_type:complete